MPRIYVHPTLQSGTEPGEAGTSPCQGRLGCVLVPRGTQNIEKSFTEREETSFGGGCLREGMRGRGRWHRHLFRGDQ